MRRRIALLLSVTPREGSSEGQIEISDVESLRKVPIRHGVVLVTLEAEPDLTVARGSVRALGDPHGTHYAIQSNHDLLDALIALLGDPGESP